MSFTTEKEANLAIRHRVYIAGISARVEKHYSIAPSTQCPKCQGFGHLENRCRRAPTCRLCSEGHPTGKHTCSVCSIKGAKCPHLVPKCSNCKGAHSADYKHCETLQAIKANPRRSFNSSSQ